MFVFCLLCNLSYLGKSFSFKKHLLYLSFYLFTEDYKQVNLIPIQIIFYVKTELKVGLWKNNSDKKCELAVCLDIEQIKGASFWRKTHPIFLYILLNQLHRKAR